MAPIKNFSVGDPIEMRIPIERMGGVKKFVDRMFIVIGVYPYFLTCLDKRGRTRTFNYGELVQNGYYERITT